VVTPRQTPERPYHHGNLREAMIEAALVAIVEAGPASISLRELARRVHVTHGAAAHHFGDKRGLLTAVATEGYELLAETVEGAAATGDFGDVGVAYVRFAADHPSHFDVMFRPDLVHQDDADLNAARATSAEVLYGSAREVSDAAGGDPIRAGIAGWAYVHGIATLWRDGNLPPSVADPVALAEELTPLLFQSSAAAKRRRARRRR